MSTQEENPSSWALIGAFTERMDLEYAFPENFGGDSHSDGKSRRTFQLPLPTGFRFAPGATISLELRGFNSQSGKEESIPRQATYTYQIRYATHDVRFFVSFEWPTNAPSTIGPFRATAVIKNLIDKSQKAAKR